MAAAVNSHSNFFMVVLSENTVDYVIRDIKFCDLLAIWSDAGGPPSDNLVVRTLYGLFPSHSDGQARAIHKLYNIKLTR